MKTVESAMSEEVKSFDVNAPVTSLSRLMADEHISCVVISNDGRPAGIISERDIVSRVVAEGKAPSALAARDIMTSPIISISPSASLHDAYELMKRKRCRRLVVADDEGVVLGLVTQSDILNALNEELKEAIHENRRLYKEALENEKLNQQIRIAGAIQRELLPDNPPTIPGIELVGSNVQARQVGGDYYDFIPLGDNKIGVAIGDVAGKGIPAALLMVMTRSIMRTQTRQSESPKDVLTKANRIFEAEELDDAFVTMFYCVVDGNRKAITFCNGGHAPLMIWKANEGKITHIDTSGMALGVLEDGDYEEIETPFELGDVVVLYTDGITDAMNIREERFRLPRLEKALARNAERSASEIHARIFQEVADFVGDVPQYDDMTMVVIKASYNSSPRA